jgi:hypothetical protein
MPEDYQSNQEKAYRLDVDQDVSEEFITWLAKETMKHKIIWIEDEEDFIYRKPDGNKEIFSSRCFVTSVGPLDMSFVSKDKHPLKQSYLYVGKGIRGTEPLQASPTSLDILRRSIKKVRSMSLDEIMKSLCS